MLKHDRGERRFQRQRLKAKRQHYYGGLVARFEGYKFLDEADEKTTKARVLGIWVRTAAVCSCDMCGNPRRVGWETRNRLGRSSTMQEKKAYLFSCVKEE